VENRAEKIFIKISNNPSTNEKRGARAQVIHTID
jgi:hypothetical protein